MKKILTITLTILAVATAYAQNFEGTIIYKNSFKSKMANLKDAQLDSMLGTIQTYYIKGGDYKSVTNGTVVQWQIYINKENKLYSKTSASAAILWNDCSVLDDTVISSKINKEVTEILGYKCDELILTFKTGVQKFYFNSKLGVDAKLYVNHKYQNWYDYLKEANAVPLKIIIDNQQFNIESVATEVKATKLDDSEFQLPLGVTTKKNPR